MLTCCHFFDGVNGAVQFILMFFIVPHHGRKKDTETLGVTQDRTSRSNYYARWPFYNCLLDFEIFLSLSLSLSPSPSLSFCLSFLPSFIMKERAVSMKVNHLYGFCSVEACVKGGNNRNDPSGDFLRVRRPFVDFCFASFSL